MNSGCLAPSGNTNMLGQRIVDSFESFQDIKDTQEPHCLPEPPPGLTIRRLKSAGLRIVTESDALWPHVSNVSNTSSHSIPVVIRRCRILGTSCVRPRADSRIYP